MRFDISKFIKQITRQIGVEFHKIKYFFFANQKSRMVLEVFLSTLLIIIIYFLINENYQLSHSLLNEKSKTHALLLENQILKEKQKIVEEVFEFNNNRFKDLNFNCQRKLRGHHLNAACEVFENSKKEINKALANNLYESGKTPSKPPKVLPAQNKWIDATSLMTNPHKMPTSKMVNDIYKNVTVDSKIDLNKEIDRIQIEKDKLIKEINDFKKK